MKSRILSMAFALLAVASTMVTAQKVSDEYAVRNLNVASGLSQNTVRTLAFDKQGFLWVGTFDGLNRFDGQRFHIYKPEKYASYLTLADPQVRKITVDATGLLWIRTYDNSFSVFRPETQSFVQITDTVGQPFNIPQGNVLTTTDSLTVVYGLTDGAELFSTRESGDPKCIWQDSKLYRDGYARGTKVWLSGHDVICLDKTGVTGVVEFPEMEHGSRGFIIVGTTGLVADGSSVIRRFDARNMTRLPDIIVPDDMSVIDIKAISEEIVAFNCKNDGIRLFDVLRHSFVELENVGAEELEGVPMKFLTDNTGATWLQTGKGKLYHYDNEKRLLHGVQALPEKTALMVDDTRICVHADRFKKGVYWITSYGGGLVRFDENTDTSEKIESELNVTPDFLLTITQDASGNIIVGSEYVGLVIVSQKPYVSRVLRPAVRNRMNAQNNIRVTYESENGNVWMGVRNSHLYVYDPTLSRELFKREGLKPYAITSDGMDRIWIGTRGQGIYVFDSKNFEQLAHFKHKSGDESSLSNNNIFKIVLDEKGRIWIATFGGGLDMLENASNLSHAYFHHFLTSNAKRKNNIRDLYQDSEGLFWTATADGIFCFNPEKLIKDPNDFIVFDFDLKDPNGISSKDVRAICEDRRHRIWLGTGGGGLNHLAFDVGKAHFRSFTKKDGLPTNVVTSLICTDDSTMWVGTENGVVLFNMNSESFTPQHLTESAMGNNFNDHAVMRRRNGKILWGSLDGLVELDPRRHTAERKLTKPVISEIIIGGRAISNNDGGILDAPASYAKLVKMPSGYTDLTIEFTNLDISNNSNYEYQYMLEGYDKEWSRPRTQKYATYSHLETGTYTFKVKPYAGGPRTIREIEIKVTSVWWRSPVMTVLYIILLAALVLFGIYQLQKYHKLLNKSSMDTQFEKRKTLFLNRFGKRVQTPLTLAKKSAEMIEENEQKHEVPTDFMSHMEIIRENLNRMNDIVEEIFETESEQQIEPLNIENTYVGPFLNEVYKSFEEKSDKQLSCSLSVPGGWHTLMDQNKVEQIVLAFINNSYKRTPAGGQVEIQALQNADRMCVIIVRDNGRSLSADGVQPNELFANKNSHKSSNSNYLSLTEANQYAAAHHGWITYSENDGGGSVFSLFIPTDYSRWEETSSTNSDQQDSDYIMLNEVEHDDSYDLKPVVMVVDDSEDIRTFLSERLSGYYSVMTATDGQNALNKIKQRIPDVIVCDANMPVLDGLKFTHKLKMSFLTSHIPVILTNSQGDKSLLRVDKAFAPSCAITKPYSYINLLEAVRKAVNRTMTVRLDFSMNYGAKVDLAQNILTEFKKMVDEIKVNERRENFGIDDLVVALGIPREQIFDCILTATGCEPGEYVKLWREERVLQYLKKGLGMESALQRIGMSDVPLIRKCIARRQKENIKGYTE